MDLDPHLPFIISKLKVISSVQLKNLCGFLFLALIRLQRKHSLKIPGGYQFTTVFLPSVPLNKSFEFFRHV
jgi:hypothetical protein